MPSINPPIGIIILAAGASSRMKGGPKQLLEFRGKTLLRRAAETALQANFETTLIVLGASHERLKIEVADLPVQVAVNENWETGISSSIKTGLSILSGKDLRAIVLMLCDQPLITSRNLQELQKRFRRNGSLIVASEYEGTVGVPALFSREVFGELMNLKGDEGAKKLIKKHLDRTNLLFMPEASLDVDTIEDFEKIKDITS